MPFPKIPKTIVYTDTVRHRPVVAWTQGPGAGGRVPVYGPLGRPILCAVMAKPASRSMDSNVHHREEHVISYVIKMDATSKPPGLKLRDQFYWPELGLTLNVLGAAPTGDSTARTWDIFAEEHRDL